MREGDAAAQSAEGVVEDVIFIGGRSLYTVRLSEGTLVRAQAQRNARVRLPSAGDAARLFWHPGDVVMLPRA